MKRFRFNLQALLDMKDRAEDQCKQDLARVNRKLFEEEAVLGRIETEWNNLQQEELDRRAKGISRPIGMGRAVEYRLWLQDQAIQQDLIIQRVKAEQEAKRQALVKATQEKKAIENIRERRFQEWRRSYLREEAKTLDDICQIQYVRNRALKEA